MKKMYHNPIIKGFHPDPSCIKVGEWFYLVTSSMEFFPCMPIYKSKDLVNWIQIGHVITRADQLDHKGQHMCVNLMAPSIRYHNGRFYVLCANQPTHQVNTPSNFIVYTDDITGEWSDAIYIEGAQGFDNDLYIEDGHAYYLATAGANPSRYKGHNVIWMQPFDLDKFVLTGEQKIIWEGSGDVWLEGPHIYRKDGYYYLLCSEGGTFYSHSVTVARSESLWGEYQSSRCNPIFTNRHLSKYNGIANVGHMEFIDAENGEWWAVCLASRPYYGANGEDYARLLGRETFLAPMCWEDGWPVIAPESGKVEKEGVAPALPTETYAPVSTFDDFDTAELAQCWNFIRLPKEKQVSLTENPGHLRLYLRNASLDNITENPTAVVRRLEEFRFVAQSKITFCPQNAQQEAGLLLQHNTNAYITFGKTVDETGAPILRITSCDNGEKIVQVQQIPACDTITLKVVHYEMECHCFAVVNQQEIEIGTAVSTKHLTSDYVHSHIGSYVGLYASTLEPTCAHYADADWFSYVDEPERH